MSNFRVKWAAIRQIIKSDDSIVICLDKDKFDYRLIGQSLMFTQLFLRIVPYVKGWYTRWLKMNSISITLVPGAAVEPSSLTDVPDEKADK